MIRIIPSLLLSEKKLVKGQNFSNYKNAGNPITTILALDSQKADEIFLIDLDAYKSRKNPDIETLKKISEILSTPLTFGGGVESVEVSKKILMNGADKVFINTAFISNKKLIEEIAYIFGSQAIVAGLNLITYKNSFIISEDNSKKIDPIVYIKELEDRGVGEIKITYVDIEGTRKGMEIEYSKKILAKARVPIIFEGGIGKLDDLKECCLNRINNIAIGSLITFSDYNIIKIKQYLSNENFEVRI